jgi:hypothetical protein
LLPLLLVLGVVVVLAAAVLVLFGWMRVHHASEAWSVKRLGREAMASPFACGSSGFT